jgi:GT2 family glycosyltransferase
MMQSADIPELADLGVVAIGRNEGERFKICLRSLQGAGVRYLVCVDSGSTDDSVAYARSLGVEVVELSTDKPFTAARARNEGFARLLVKWPNLKYVQFIDGDCEICKSWLPAAKSFLETHPRVAAVNGRRRERYPELSVFNRICEIEWDTPVGEARTFGGDVLCSVEAVQAIGGYSEQMIAGEDPEFGVRLRKAGWMLWCLPNPMTIHDATLLKVSQWWRRAVRTGYAYAHGVTLHGAKPERFFVKELRSALMWGVASPLATIVAAIIDPRWLAVALIVFVVQVVRIWFGVGRARVGSFAYALSAVLAKVPEAVGAAWFVYRRWTHRPTRIIEYK